MMASGMGLASPWYWLGWVLVIASLVGTVAALVWVIRMLSTKAPQAETPLAILNRRFAAGEITTKEFEANKGRLSKG
jgi:putative membrane protein